MVVYTSAMLYFLIFAGFLATSRAALFLTPPTLAWVSIYEFNDKFNYEGIETKILDEEET